MMKTNSWQTKLKGDPLSWLLELDVPDYPYEHYSFP
jgi:hypothetical protein